MTDAIRTKDFITDESLRECTPRVARLYSVLQERMTRKQMKWGGELSIFGEPRIEEEPVVIRHAIAFEKTLREMPIAIEESDLIAGITLQDDILVRTELPRFLTEPELRDARDTKAESGSVLSHKTPYYPRMLEIGISGVLQEIDQKLAKLDDHQSQEIHLFKAMRRECTAVIAFAHRFAKLAEQLAKGESDTGRREELEEISRICLRVPEFPPESFYEAVQSFWIVNYAFFSTRTMISCGRLDQYLYPFLKADLEANRISIERAQELVDCLWLRFNDRGQILRENYYNTVALGKKNNTGNAARPGESWVWKAGHRDRFAFYDDAADAVNHFGQNLLLGGIRPDGTDGTNELTYLSLNAMEKFALTSPVVTVRLWEKSPDELIHRTSEVLKKGGGMPYVNNDDVIIKAYCDLGVPIEDARDYANSNCWETMIEGKSDQELVRGINFLLYLELALNKGNASVHGKQLGPDTGDPRDFSTFEELMEAWRIQTDFQLKTAIDFIGGGIRTGSLEHSSHGKYCYNPFLSALVLDCIENEKDVTRCGPRYVIWHLMAEALADAANAMAAIKFLVYEKKEIGIDELLKAVESNWDGFENLRQKLMRRIPKFGNDEDYADAIGRELMDYFVDRSRHYAARYPEIIFPTAAGTFSWYVMIGKEVGATPDGRHTGDPVAANLSAVPGTDLSGPTAVINSYVKMRVDDLAGGAPLDLRLSKTSLKEEEGTRRLDGLIKTFIGMGGNMATFTVTDVDELKRAVEEPENYRHLRVRMGGWSAYFVMLSEEQQRLHIERVEHGMA
jgi:choline trimethylamine-lyase